MSSYSSDSESSSSSSRSRSRENKKRKRDKKEKKKSSKKLKSEKKSKKDKKEKKSKKDKKEKLDPVTERLKKSMLEALYPEKVGQKPPLSDEEKKALLLEQNKDKLYKKVVVKDRTGEISRSSAVMKGAKGPMSAAEAKAYDIHMDQMRGGTGAAERSRSTY